MFRRQAHPSPFGEPCEWARQYEAGRSDQIAFSQYEVGGEIVRGPAFDQRGSGRSEFIEEAAQLEALVGVEGDLLHRCAISGSASRWAEHVGLTVLEAEERAALVTLAGRTFAGAERDEDHTADAVG